MIKLTEKQTQAFWNKVDKTDFCWNWTGYSNSQGYGTINIDKKIMRAHRLSYMIHKGQIPKDYFICHHGCDNPGCVNPDHLFPDTHKGNMQDMVRKGRSKKKLSNKDVAMIVRLLPTMSNTQIAKLLNNKVSFSAICEIRAGRNWSHLTGIKQAVG